VKIFADTADWKEMSRLATDDQVQGFTTNPTLARKAGVKNYAEWGAVCAEMFSELPISFEVVGDDEDEMYRQARLIASWGKNVYVKIPVTDTSGRPMRGMIGRLVKDGIKVNVTAVFTRTQVFDLQLVLEQKVPSIISIFAGRIHDAGQDATRTFRDCRAIATVIGAQLLWASPRQVYDIILAEDCGADIITVTPELLAKAKLIGKDLDEFSRETVQMFYDDAKQAGFTL